MLVPPSPPLRGSLIALQTRLLSGLSFSSQATNQEALPSPLEVIQEEGDLMSVVVVVVVV